MMMFLRCGLSQYIFNMGVSSHRRNATSKTAVIGFFVHYDDVVVVVVVVVVD